MTLHAASVSSSVWTRATIALVPVWLVTAVLLFGAPLPMKFIVGFTAALTLASPYYGLLAVAAFVPLCDFAGILLNLGSYRLGEAVTVAFLTAWLVRGEGARRGPRVASAPASLIAAIVAASMIATATRSSEALRSTIEWAFYGYFLLPHPSGWVDGARLLEGIGMVIAVFAVLRWRPRLAVTLPAALTVSLAVASLTSILLWFQIAPAAILQRHALIGYRYTAHVPDVNAAGSYFVLCVCVALGMTVRAGGRDRIPWLAAVAAGSVGAWLAGSRMANAAALIAVGGSAAWWMVADWSRRAKATLAIFAAAIVLVSGLYEIRQLTRDRDYRSADFRRQFNAASVRMIAAAPASGVGIGQYRQASSLFFGPALAYSYGAENAHNYFLQFGAELGLVGFAALIWWLGTGLAKAFRAAVVTPHDGRLLGLIAATIAFVATWATGHPLLLTEVAVPFWMTFGLMWALADSQLPPAGRRSRSVWTTAVTAGAITLAVAVQASAPDVTLRPPQSQNVTGLYDWETDADGSRYRWTEEYASLFVPSDVTRIYVPVRVPAVSSTVSPMQVEARTEGRPGTRTLVGDGWVIFNLELPDAAPFAHFKRINLHADRIWRPALYRAGSTDMREVGVQVGEVKLFRER